MAAAPGLIQRLAGITALCLIAVAAPLSVTERTGLLTAVAAGVTVAALAPGTDRWASALVGPAVVVLTVVPVGRGWLPVHLAALVATGVAALDRRAMTRLVPALGLPLLTALYRAGASVPDGLVALWAILVAVVVVLDADRPAPSAGGPETGTGRPEAAAIRPRSTVTVGAVARAGSTVAVVAAAAVLASGPVLTATARLIPARFLAPGAGAEAEAPTGVVGPGAMAHPGLTGGLDVGEPVVLTEDEVLRVRSEVPLYWRAATYDVWDGRRWTAGAAPGPPPPAPVGRGPEVGPPPSRAVVQDVTVLGAGLGVAPTAWSVTAIEVPDRTATIVDDGTVVLDRALEPGDRWTATSAVVPVEADDLRAADPRLLDPGDPFLVRYAREDDVPAPVAELAATVTSDAATTYDAVLAIEAWMDDNLTYTRDIDRLPPGRDAVSNLLFGDRRGYCEQIGSALVVLLRSLGIPARLVVGYVPGAFDGAAGEWVSRGTDAHVWAEVYFPGVGWQGFDPTAGVPLAGEAPTSLGPAPRPPSPAVTAPRAAALGVVLLVVAAVGGLLAGRRRRGPDPTPDGRDPRAAVRRLDDVGAEVGLTWAPSATVRDRGTDLVAAGLDPDAVDGAVRAVELVLYGHHPGGPEPMVDAAVARDLDQRLSRLEASVRSDEFESVEGVAVPSGR